jgi:hypothetical protein
MTETLEHLGRIAGTPCANVEIEVIVEHSVEQQ